MALIELKVSVTETAALCLINIAREEKRYCQGIEVNPEKTYSLSSRK